MFIRCLEHGLNVTTHWLQCFCSEGAAMLDAFHNEIALHETKTSHAVTHAYERVSTAKHQIEVARASDDPVTLRLALAAYSKALFAYQDLRGGALGSWHPEE